jgi:hypothetical protein
VTGRTEEREHKGRLLVLANSRKEGGRCLALVDEDGSWCRPVSGHGTGELTATQCRNPTGTGQLLPLDIVSAGFGSAVGSHYQPEDFICPTRWESAEPVSIEELRGWLEATVDHRADFLGRDRPDRISEESATSRHLSSSLALVKPDWIHVQRKLGYGGRTQWRALFSSRSIPDSSGRPIEFDLVITDDNWTRMADSWPRDRYVLRDDKVAGDVFLTISLGVPFNGAHYKLVAAVITAYELDRAVLRPDSAVRPS